MSQLQSGAGAFTQFLWPKNGNLYPDNYKVYYTFSHDSGKSDAAKDIMMKRILLQGGLVKYLYGGWQPIEEIKYYKEFAGEAQKSKARVLDAQARIIQRHVRVRQEKKLRVAAANYIKAHWLQHHYRYGGGFWVSAASRDSGFGTL